MTFLRIHRRFCAARDALSAGLPLAGTPQQTQAKHPPSSAPDLPPVVDGLGVVAQCGEHGPISRVDAHTARVIHACGWQMWVGGQM